MSATSLLKVVRTLTFIAAALFAAALARAQTTATVRSSAIIPAGSPVMLGQIADILGDQQQLLSGLVILAPAAAPAPTAVLDTDDSPAAPAAAAPAPVWVKIDMDTIRHAVETRPGIAAGTIALRGGDCWIRYAMSPAPTTAPAAPAAAAPIPAKGSTHVTSNPNRAFAATDAISGGTVLELIAARLAAEYNVPSVDLRMRTASAGTEEAIFINSPLPTSSRVELIPMGGISGGRVAIKVELFSGARVSSVKTVTVEPIVRRQVVIASQSIERDQVITDDFTVTDERWVSPGAPASVTPERAAGCNARRRINAGQVVVAADLLLPVAVERGETIWVQCLSTGISLKVKAVSLGQAREGEMVELQKPGAKKTFMARMTGKGLAVMNLNATGDSAPPPDDAFTPLKTRNRRGAK